MYENTIKFIEYIRSGPKQITGYSLDEHNKEVANYSKPTRKVGVMVAGLDPSDSNKVIYGFSLCHKTDRWNYANDKHIKGHGIKIAWDRACKHTNTKWAKMQSQTLIPAEARSIADSENRWIPEVKIHQSIQSRFIRFVNGTMKSNAFKGKRAPAWVNCMLNEKELNFINIEAAQLAKLTLQGYIA